jgi:hypothetical protein
VYVLVFVRGQIRFVPDWRRSPPTTTPRITTALGEDAHRRTTLDRQDPGGAFAPRTRRAYLQVAAAVADGFTA